MCKPSSYESLHILNYLIFIDDATNEFSQSPPPGKPTVGYVDNNYAEWNNKKYGKEVDLHKVIPVQHALQVHPESVRIWDALHGNGI